MRSILYKNVVEPHTVKKMLQKADTEEKIDTLKDIERIIEKKLNSGKFKVTITPYEKDLNLLTMTISIETDITLPQ